MKWVEAGGRLWGSYEISQLKIIEFSFRIITVMHIVLPFITMYLLLHSIKYSFLHA